MLNITHLYCILLMLQGTPQAASMPDSLIFREQFIKAREERNGSEMARAWLLQANAYQELGNYSESDRALNHALHIADSVKDYVMRGKVMNLQAINLSATGKREEGIAMSFSAFDSYMLAGDTVRAANVKINIGMDYTNQGRYEEALKVELEALGLRLACGDSTNIATFYQHIGEIYKELGIREKWISALETAYRLAENPEYADFKTRIGILNDYGGVREAEKRYEEAAEIYLRMYSQSREEAYANGMATAQNNSVPVYLAMGQKEKAAQAALEALNIYEALHNYYGILTVYNRLGKISLAMDQAGAARGYFLKGLQIAQQYAYAEDQGTSLEGLYQAAGQSGNWKEALFYHEAWSALTDSLQNIELKKTLAELETKFQTEKKEQQIALLNRENEVKEARLQAQQTAIWSGSILVIIVAGITFFMVKQRRRRQLIRQSELEQKLLRSQMNPHFIFNSLGAIQHFMMKNDGRVAAFYLSSFSSLMRSILKNSREELITLEEEIQTLQNYLNLHQLRLGEKLSFSISASDDLEAGWVKIPPMLVQPFVENAIHHGIEKMEGNGRVSIDFKKTGDQLQITVEDNGGGIDTLSETTKKEHISYALQIFRERVDNLKRASGIEISHRIENRNSGPDQQKGTLVTVVLPLR